MHVVGVGDQVRKPPKACKFLVVAKVIQLDKTGLPGLFPSGKIGQHDEPEVSNPTHL